MRNVIILFISLAFAIVILSIILCLSLTTTTAANNALAETNIQENDNNSSAIPAMQGESSTINDTILISEGGSSGDPTIVPMVTTVPEYHPVTIQYSSSPTPARNSMGKTPPMPPPRQDGKYPLPTVRVN